MREENPLGGDREGTQAGVAGANSNRPLRIRTAAEIREEATEWLWKDDVGKWLPLGALSLLAGREGIGKSTIAYGLAAQITKGTLPGDDFGTPRSVVVFASEEGWGQAIKPRLMAAGADMTRIIDLAVMVEADIETPVSLPMDLANLKRVCLDRDVSLILMDPLVSVLAEGLDMRKFPQVQRALENLARLGQEVRAAVLGLVQLNKSAGADQLSRIMDSRAFVSVSRSVLMAIRDEKPTDSTDDREYFFLGQEKSSFGPRSSYILRYHIDSEEVGVDEKNGLPITGQRIAFDGAVRGSVQAVATAHESRSSGRITAGGRAEEWIKAFLSENGRTPSTKVKEAASEAGHSLATLKRAAKAVGVEVPTIPGSNKTEWVLPTSEPLELLEPVDLVEPVEPKIPATTTSGSTGSSSSTDQLPEELSRTSRKSKVLRLKKPPKKVEDREDFFGLVDENGDVWDF